MALEDKYEAMKLDFIVTEVKYHELQKNLGHCQRDIL